MKFYIFCIGKIKDSYYSDMILENQKRIRQRGHDLIIKEYPDIKIPDGINDNNKKKLVDKECSKILSDLPKSSYVVALCIEGKEISSSEYVSKILKARDNGCNEICYVIGGSMGLSDEIKARADLKYSVSKMTFPHQMFRALLTDELFAICSRL